MQSGDGEANALREQIEAVKGAVTALVAHPQFDFDALFEEVTETAYFGRDAMATKALTKLWVKEKEKSADQTDKAQEII